MVHRQRLRPRLVCRCGGRRLALHPHRAQRGGRGLLACSPAGVEKFQSEVAAGRVVTIQNSPRQCARNIQRFGLPFSYPKLA